MINTKLNPPPAIAETPRCVCCGEPRTAMCEHYRAYAAELAALDPARDIHISRLGALAGGAR